MGSLRLHKCCLPTIYRCRSRAWTRHVQTSRSETENKNNRSEAKYIQSNFDGSNTFGTMQLSSRQGQFEPIRVDHSARSGDLIRVSLIFYNMKVYCVLSLESPRWGDSNEHTQYTIFNMKKKSNLNYPKSAAMGVVSKGLKNEFETAKENEPSVFEPPKFYCIV